VKRLESQRDILMKKLADSDSEILRIRSELFQKNNELEQLITQVNWLISTITNVVIVLQTIHHALICASFRFHFTVLTLIV